ncbi:MAG: hypothetical protein LBD68_04575 [Zoogloeaceae bacterium]|jgi:hypothetical protein|nr:hypothetical protein [Zoogloeaceae bacterium]
MAYSLQQVGSFEEIRLAIWNRLVDEGWSLSDDIISKDGVFAQLTFDANYLSLHCGTGASSGAITDGPTMLTGYPGTRYQTRVGRVMRNASWSPFAFPARLLLFTFPSEVYAVINTNVDEYQYLAFGKSGVPGLPGSGVWFAGTFGHANVGSGNGGNSFNMNVQVGGAYYQNNKSACGLFWNNDATNAFPYNGYNSWFHHGFTDSSITSAASPEWAYALGQAHLAPLYALMPNNWNSESALLPIRAYAQRPSSTISLAGELANARLIRIDNLVPEQVITLGTDEWLVLPWFKKDTTNRDGSTLTANATGTLGWAIRREA